ncbi:MAG: hypothetical protein IIC74_03125 [Bacteroidetes bacterium]|nr:hypothetical protein [Bacteroidota bacterium]
MLEGLNNTRSLPELEKVTDPETPDPEELEKVDDPEIINPVDIVVKEGVEKSGLEKVTETNGGTNTPPWVQK